MLADELLGAKPAPLLLERYTGHCFITNKAKALHKTRNRFEACEDPLPFFVMFFEGPS